MPITHEWNGTILTITSDSGTSSADLKGEKGDDGVRGAQGIPGSMATDALSLGGIAAAEYALKSDISKDAETLAGKAATEYVLQADLDAYPTEDEVAAAIKEAEVDLTGYATEEYVNAKMPDVEQYATKEYVHSNVPSLDGYATEAYVNAAIPTYDGYASKDYVDDKIAGMGLAKNQLDNSYFPSAYVINQRGLTTYTGSGYTVDRWRINSAATVSITANGVEVDATSVKANLQQNFENLPNGIFTFAAKVNDNIVYRVIENNNGTITTLNNSKAAFTGGYLALGKGSAYYAQIVNSEGYKNKIEWAALYEGEYTVETLPQYIPKGYAAELLECQRYFYSTQGSYFYCGYGSATSATELYANIVVPVKMRIKPTVSNKGQFVARGNGKEHAITQSQVEYSTANGITIAFTGTGFTQYETYLLRTTGTVEMSADL